MSQTVSSMIAECLQNGTLTDENIATGILERRSDVIYHRIRMSGSSAPRNVCILFTSPDIEMIKAEIGKILNETSGGADMDQIATRITHKYGHQAIVHDLDEKTLSLAELFEHAPA